MGAPEESIARHLRGSSSPGLDGGLGGRIMAIFLYDAMIDLASDA